MDISFHSVQSDHSTFTLHQGDGNKPCQSNKGNLQCLCLKQLAGQKIRLNIFIKGWGVANNL
jgi:hypothetical protein